MNKVYRIVWSDAKQTYVVASEKTAARGKRSSTVKSAASAVVGALFAQAVHAAPDSGELPAGGHVIAGQAAIRQSGSAMTVQQESSRTIINWHSFNIGSQASVDFQQPSSGSVALNRVVGSDPSAIYGSLTANGQVFLINPNGVLFGQGARVDVGGLVASTLDIRNEDFLAGDNRFTRDGALGSVVNRATINAKYVALLAPEVLNEGVIAARQGTVVMAAGDAITLNITGNQLIDVQVDKASIDTLVENKHLVQADEGMVVMSAHSANELLGRVVNSGTVEAKGIVSDGGVVRLLASDSIDHSGNINVDGGTSGNGGEAIVLASLNNPDSIATVSGSITARGGSQSGNGGFIETSATHIKIADSARIDTRAPNGAGGKWLIDPDDFIVAAAGGDITGAVLGNLLDMTDIIIETTATTSGCTEVPAVVSCGAGATAGSGDIIINDAVSWTSPFSLGLDAYRNIEINESLSFDSFSGATLQIIYGTGGTGKAVVAQGVDLSSAGLAFDSTNGQVTDLALVDTSRPYYIGTVNSPIYVELLMGSGVYGDTNLPWAYFDAAGGTRININDPAGSVTWSSNPATLNAGGPYALSYVSGLSSAYYSGFTAGNAANWTVTPRPIELTASDRSKTYGQTLTLGSTAFALTGGSLANSETVASVTLGSTNGYATDPAQTVGTYNDEITIAGATGGGGFNASNYAITYVTGALTINKATLTYVANAKNMTAGDALPVLDGTVTGFVNGENLAGATTGVLGFDTPATSSSAAKSYAINGVGLAAINYDFVQATANATALTINAAASTDIIAIIQRSLQALANQGNAEAKKYLDIGNNRSGVLPDGLGDATKFIQRAVAQSCPHCSIKDADVVTYLGGSRTFGINKLRADWERAHKLAIREAYAIGHGGWKTKLMMKDSVTDLYTVSWLLKWGYTAKDFKDAGIPIGKLVRPAGITTQKVDRGCGATCGRKTEMYTTEVTHVQSKTPAFTRDQLLAAGYSGDEITSVFGVGHSAGPGESIPGATERWDKRLK